jgi:hypothetical protein
LHDFSLQRKAELKRDHKREQMRARKAALSGQALGDLGGAGGVGGAGLLAGRARPRGRGEDGDGFSREPTPDLAALLESAGPLEDPFAVRCV